MGWTDEAVARSREQGTGIILVIPLVLLHGNTVVQWLALLAWLITLSVPDTDDESPPPLLASSPHTMPTPSWVPHPPLPS